MGKLRILNTSGDTTVVWDAAKAEAGDLDAQAAVREAEHIFSEHRAKGGAAVAIDTDDPLKPGHVITAFDVTAPQIVLIPRMVGG